MNNYRTLIVLVVVFFALSALVALQGNPELVATLPPTATPQPQPDGSLLRVFPDLAVLDIQAIRLEDVATRQNLTLVRDQQGNWTMPGIGDALDSNAASGIARTLTLFPYARSLNILSATNFSDYGFNPNGQLIFQIITSDGSGHIIAVGNLTDSGAAYYTLVDDRDEIFEVERGPIEFLRNFILSPPINLTN